MTYSTDELKALGEKGQAFKNADGTYSYPIANATDLDNAIRAVGRGNADHDAIRRYIIKRARELNMADRVPDTWNDDGSLKRSEALDTVRSYLLEDMTVRSDGEGRTVEAYAAVFDVGAEIKDRDGHYIEKLAPTSFDRTVSQRGTNFGVFYNHARTLYGTPDGTLSVPIAVCAEQPRPDGRGVVTISRYLDNPLADSVLDGIKQRAIRGQSFSGRMISSDLPRPRGGYRADRDGTLPTVTRTEIAMREYGPTVFPAYAEAAILNVRSVSTWLDEITSADPEDIDRLRHLLGIATPLTDPATPLGTSSTEPAGHPSHLTLRAKARKIGAL